MAPGGQQGQGEQGSAVHRDRGWSLFFTFYGEADVLTDDLL
jgi:hypothetical protein